MKWWLCCLSVYTFGAIETIFCLCLQIVKWWLCCRIVCRFAAMVTIFTCYVCLQVWSHVGPQPVPRRRGDHSPRQPDLHWPPLLQPSNQVGRHSAAFKTIIIIQEISIAHDPELKSWGTIRSQKNAECITYKNKKTKKAHHNYHTLDDRTIIQSTTAGKVDNPVTTNCTSVHLHVIKYSIYITHYF